MDEDLLERAVRLAVKVHKGQKDRTGRPFMLHVLRVAMSGNDLEEQVLGALHDVLERSDLTRSDLEDKGFPARILDALDHLTRSKEEDYEAYIGRVMRNDLARRVKLHDLGDKLDLWQHRELLPADLKRYNRQLAALHRLRGAAGPAQGM
ncbi:MAG TPA: phosphohydrolase [Flavobacteriales bacterium]|nr:phosphohydrolase [Flavobacteriales bacterium]